MNVVDTDLETLPIATSMNKSCTLNWKEKSIEVLGNSISENKISTSRESSYKLLMKKEAIKKKLSSEKSEMIRIRKQLDELEAEIEKDPNKYTLKLFQVISNITWDLTKLPNEVKGYISTPFTVFSYNVDRITEFSIVNYLWKLIGDQ